MKADNQVGLETSEMAGFQELYQFYFSEAGMLKSGITDNFADVKKQTAYFPLYMQNST